MDRRARSLAQVAADLGRRHGIVLPPDLQLWALAGGRPADRSAPAEGPDADAAASALGAALEGELTEAERRRGAHYTPAALADRVAALALASPDLPDRPTVADPACGGGALLLAAARLLAARGIDRSLIVRDLLFGADLDPVAAAVTEAVLTLWSGGSAPRRGHVVAADTLHDAPPWPAGFDAVVANPPFQGQLSRDTARSPAELRRLRERWGAAVSPYVDTAALFLLVAVELARSGGRVAVIQPQSTVAARDAAGVRSALAVRARLEQVWAPEGRQFSAQVHVSVPVLAVGPTVGSTGETAHDGDQEWADALADGRGIPRVAWATPSRAKVADLAEVLAGFRDEYYGLVPHVRERDGETDEGAPVITSGAIDPGRLHWGERAVRFAKVRWAAPVVDLHRIAGGPPRLAAWVERLQRPKVLVASQTRVIEAAADRAGTSVPVTPVISVLPHDTSVVDRLAAALCAPPVSVWAARRAAGTALSADAIRVSASLVAAVPLPVDERTWEEASELLAAGDLDAFGAAATAMYGLPRSDAAEVLAWWSARRPSAG